MSFLPQNPLCAMDILTPPSPTGSVPDWKCKAAWVWFTPPGDSSPRRYGDVHKLHKQCLRLSLNVVTSSHQLSVNLVNRVVNQVHSYNREDKLPKLRAIEWKQIHFATHKQRRKRSRSHYSWMPMVKLLLLPITECVSST